MAKVKLDREVEWEVAMLVFSQAVSSRANKYVEFDSETQVLSFQGMDGRQRHVHTGTWMATEDKPAVFDGEGGRS